jgi:hypothetical protein
MSKHLMTGTPYLQWLFHWLQFRDTVHNCRWEDCQEQLRAMCRQVLCAPDVRSRRAYRVSASRDIEPQSFAWDNSFSRGFRLHICLTFSLAMSVFNVCKNMPACGCVTVSLSRHFFSFGNME